MVSVEKAIVKARIMGKGEKEGELVIRIDDRYLPLLRRFAKDQEAMRKDIELTFILWPCFSERAFKYFHVLRDALCEKAGDTTRSYKEHMKTSLKEDCAKQRDPAMLKETGEIKSSADFTTSQLIVLIDFTLDRCAEEECDMEALMPAHRELQDEWAKEQNK